MCYSRKKSNKASWGYTFLKSPLEYLDLSLYPCKFKTKKAFTTGNSANLCDTPGNSKVENQDLWKIYMNFSPSSLEIPLVLFDPWNFHMVLPQILLECPHPSLFGFFLQYLNDQRTYDNIQKLATGQGDDCITCYLLDYVCFKIIIRW